MRSNFHRKLGNCPNMSEAEWRAVSLGLRANMALLAGYHARHQPPTPPEDVPPPNWERLSPATRQRLWDEPWKVQARAERQRKLAEHPGTEYWALLWRQEVAEDRIMVPRDPVANDVRYVRFLAAECCCRCALARSAEGCGDMGEGCVRVGVTPMASFELEAKGGRV